MKSRFFSMILSAVLLCSCFTGCESSQPVMDTETSRPVMDEFINSDQFAIRVIYDGMNLEFYYAKDGSNEFLGTTMANTQSAIMRNGDYTYYIDVVGSGEVRCVQGDTTDLNYAYDILNTIYNQTVVNGTLVTQRHLGEGDMYLSVDNYTYHDEENNTDIGWQISVRDNMIIQAHRLSDDRVFIFEYPDFTTDVFYIPEEYNIVGGPKPDFSKGGIKGDVSE